MAKRLDQLKKIKMPAKPMGEKEAEQDLDMELGEMGPEGEDMPAEPGMPKEPGLEGEDEMGEMEESPLAEFDDQMLIEEMKKRGLSLDGKTEEEEEVELPE